MQKLDGNSLFGAFASGGRRVINYQGHLNKINVFPVPDGDTGTNLASTFFSIFTHGKPHVSASKTLRSIAEQALIGARGNSGIILAQFFNGLSEGCGNEQYLSPGLFGQAVDRAVERSYEALSHPVEGTMLTVIRDWAESVKERCHRVKDFSHLFQTSIQAALRSLKSTPEKLKVLKEARVVDAGAEGFVHFLRGTLDFIKSGKSGRAVPAFDMPQEIPGEDFLPEGALAFRYCTEALIKGAAIDHHLLSAQLEPCGDSLIVAGTSSFTRVHIHTDSPEEVMEKLRPLGKIVQQKADDMVRQQEAVYHRKYPIALLTDSVCDLPQSLLDEYQIHVVPITLSFGENQFLDKLTITPDRFYTLLDQLPEKPTTSQPPADTFRQLYEFLSSHYESIIAIHLSSRLSGTWNTSRLEARRIEGKKISVIDSRTLSGSLGLVVLRAAEAIAAGKTHEQVVETISSSLPKARIFVSVPTLKYMVRGGRVSPLQGALGKLMNLKPIVSMDSEGKSVLFGKAFSRRSNLKKIMRMVADLHRESPLRSYAVVHAHAPAAAQSLGREIERIVGRPPSYLMDISPVVGMNAGAGSVSVVTMQE